MATISTGLRRAFNNLGSCPRAFNYTIGHSEPVAPFKYYIEVPINKDNIVLPIWCINNVLSYYSKDLNITKFIVDIDSIYDFSSTVKTADAMLKHFFSYNSNAKLSAISNGKSKKYYGSKGIIFDENFRILMCMYIPIEYDANSHIGIPKRPILQVNPSVFLDQQEFMNKAIIQKIIPLSQEPMYISSYISGIQGKTFNSFKIIVDESFAVSVVCPLSPSPSKVDSDAFNKTLLDNINDIYSFIE